MIERQGLIVWVYSLRNLKILKRHGLVHYVSKKMKYVVLYTNREDIEMLERKIKELHFVRKVERSYRPEIDMNFSERIGTSQRDIKEVNEAELTETILIEPV
ncbi:YlbG family protein [Isobaculum melis]|uniref:Uncharacterized protein YlbG, UPF0298 family n=1 Tax=Isobaculum melis TaxID=142588 RepID=A0A1H9RU50_9LACT|nr:YlbG family protein [Isobaculum melis]SER76461.1 Uncharacterized protein YlbG, UPF0298 family [Isobaculum melis]